MLHGEDTGRKADLLDRVFGDQQTTRGRLGCFGSLGAFVALGCAGIAFYTEQAQIWATQNAKAEARIAAEEKARDDERESAIYQRNVADGSICADGYDRSNVDLIETVKANLRDPDSFRHDVTMIGPRGADGNYKFAMQYGAKNGFGGYTRGYVTGVLTLIGRNTCRVVDLQMGS